MEPSIFIKVSQIYESVEFSKIRWIQADGNHSIIHSFDRKFIVKIALKSLIEQILPDYFLQIHRQIVINLNVIEEIDLANNIVIGGKNNYPVGRTYRPSLLAHITLLN